MRRRTISTTQIKDSVWEVLAELEEDDDRQEQFAGIRKAQRVRVFSGKSHATIWGKGVKRLSEIPSPARHLFEEVLRLESSAARDPRLDLGRHHRG